MPEIVERLQAHADRNIARFGLLDGGEEARELDLLDALALAERGV
jgi:hypothetical protein